MAKSNNNPHKVNQYTDPDPRQIEFLKNYLNPKSKTFGQGYASAIKAGYSEQYAKVIKSQQPEWLSRNLKNSKRLYRTEKNIEEVQSLKLYKKYVIKVGDKTEVVEKLDPNILKVRTDLDKFIAKSHDKDTYSERIDLTTKGEKITPIFGGQSNKQS